MINNKKDVESQRLCFECVGEALLRNQIERRGREETCFYCKVFRKTISIGQMADRIEIGIQSHYYLTATELNDYEVVLSCLPGYQWERAGDPVIDVIGDYAKIAYRPAKDIQSVLEDWHFEVDRAKNGKENPFSEEAQYIEADALDPQDENRYMEQGEKVSRRHSIDLRKNPIFYS
jgi:hypothetical protein